MTPRLAGALVGAALLVAAAGTVAATRAAPAVTGDGRLVLVSGRDDHGLLATAQVTLRDRPASDAAEAGQVTDGTLARVVEIRGNWLRVRAAEGPAAQGWVDDFFLRGGVHLVGPPPTCAVPFDGGTLPEGEQAVVLDLRDGHARVRVNRTGATGWVERTVIREIVPERCGQPDRDEPPDDHHHDHG